MWALAQGSSSRLKQAREIVRAMRRRSRARK
jgi:hypothetical protein